MMGPLAPGHDRTVIVTGAGGGLGTAISRRLLADGYRCVLADMNGAALTKTAESFGPLRTSCTEIVCDLRLIDERKRLIAEGTAGSARLYGLVNCAGIALTNPFFDETVSDWREILSVNLEAAFFLSQLAIEHMRSHAEGRIVNLASVYGFMGFNNLGYGARAPEATPGDRGPVRQSAYAASKGGLIQLTRELAAAAGRWNVTVNAVSPGSIPHPEPEDGATSEKHASPPPSTQARLGDRVDPAILKALAGQVPLQRLGLVDEIAGPVSFLLSKDASYITGANLVVDGGWSIW